MKKCAIVYTNNENGKEYWSDSVDEKGCTYRLVPKTSDIPKNHCEATEFYGKHMFECAKKRIVKDQKYGRCDGLTARIIEYDREPEWYFELWDELNYRFGDNTHNEVKKRFPLNSDVHYKLLPGHDRPFICDLDLEELQRYYEWRKDHYRGKREKRMKGDNYE